MTGTEDLVPPADMIELVGSESRENFAAIGRQVLGHVIELCGLEPDDDVLDIGCGAGRVAIPLTSYLSPAGSYEGFDVVPELVQWCTNEIASRHANFRFSHADLFHGHYHPQSTKHTRDFRFPFRDQQFDVAIANSIFTHMFPPDLECYLSEAARVLRRGGTMLATFFLINDGSLDLIRSDASTLDFEIDRGSHRVAWEHAPEAAVAHPEDHVLRIARRHGFQKLGPIHYGSWPGRPEWLDYQDIVILVRDR